jgi:hypothetical protein
MKSGSKISDPILQQVVLATGEFPKKNSTTKPGAI